MLQNLLVEQIADSEAMIKVLEAQTEVGILKTDPLLQARLGLLGQRETRDLNNYRMLVWYAALQRAAGGNWKWTQ